MKNTPLIKKFFNPRNIIALKNIDKIYIPNLFGVILKKKYLKFFLFNKVYKIETNSKEDFSTYYSIFCREDYSFPVTKIDKIFDFGANIGLASIFFHKKFPNVNIDCYEPHPTIFKLLKNNTSNFKKINCSNKAVSSISGEFEFFHSKTGKTSGLDLNYVNDYDGISSKVRVINIIEILKPYTKQNILVKLDIEGMEMSVLDTISEIKNEKNWYIVLEKDVNFDRAFLSDFHVVQENDLIIKLIKTPN